jgi:hypothetical protein
MKGNQCLRTKTVILIRTTITYRIMLGSIHNLTFQDIVYDASVFIIMWSVVGMMLKIISKKEESPYLMKRKR